MKIAVTGAFGYSGRYIAKRTLGRGYTSEMARRTDRASKYRSN